ncbi:hypothetical protein [Pseudonocardia acaciae]|uniref:hypothetical protein n=1 Tax=Pseudonocardia acaciae TaxID=551276 RepID=UPI00055AB0D4|nr:hypothetical protein [Pseudonocardia acaciae]
MVTDANGSGGVKLEPHMIPRLRSAFQSAFDQLADAGQEGDLQIARPAMADQASVDYQSEFNQAAAEAGQQLRDYRARLQQVLQQLDAIQQAYDRQEYDTAAELAAKLEP